jgi:hypothetical protein
MADEEKRSGGGGLHRLVLWLVIAGLMVMLWVLASERNQRHFRVTTENGHLMIERGRSFPIGNAPAGEKMYAPIDLPPGEKPSGEMEFDDQNALDQYLFGIWGSWAKTATQKGDTKTAAALVERAAVLPGLTGQQHEELSTLRAALAWDEAQSDLANASKLIDDARRKLDLVRQNNGAHAPDAAAMQPKLQSVAEGLSGALPKR